MKKRLLIRLFFLSLIPYANADSLQYSMRVDGMACPFCAYNIEKKFKQLEGASHVRINLDEGRVDVTMAEGKTLTEPQVQALFEDAGFSFRGMSSKSVK